MHDGFQKLYQQEQRRQFGDRATENDTNIHPDPGRETNTTINSEPGIQFPS